MTITDIQIIQSALLSIFSLILGLGNNTIANMFGGNSVSSIANLYLFVRGQASPPDPARTVARGASLGVPLNDALKLAGKGEIAGLKSVTGTVRSTALKTLFNAATQPSSVASIAAEGGEVALEGGITASEYASGIAIAKFVFDGATFLYGYFTCPQ